MALLTDENSPLFFIFFIPFFFCLFFFGTVRSLMTAHFEPAIVSLLRIWRSHGLVEHGVVRSRPWMCVSLSAAGSSEKFKSSAPQLLLTVLPFDGSPGRMSHRGEFPHSARKLTSFL